MKETKASSTWTLPGQSPGVRRTQTTTGKRATGGRINFSLKKTELTRMVNQIKEEVNSHQRTAKEIEKKMEKLARCAFEELLKVRELKEVIESLKRQTPLSGKSEGIPEGGGKLPPWKLDLDRNLERLLAIKQLLESSLGVKKEKLEETPLPRPSASDKKKIFVVDDDPTTLKIIAHFLERENFSVRTSLSGAEGLKMAFQDNPDLILLDIMMPDLNGFQFLSIFQKDKQTARIPVIILSSLAEEADVLRGLGTGAVDYITKPFSPPVLLAKIKKSFNSKP